MGRIGAVIKGLVRLSRGTGRAFGHLWTGFCALHLVARYGRSGLALAPVCGSAALDHALSKSPHWPWLLVVGLSVGAALGLLVGLAAMRESEVTYLRRELREARQKHAEDIERERERYHQMTGWFAAQGMTSSGIPSGGASVGETGPAGPPTNGRNVVLQGTATIKVNATAVGPSAIPMGTGVASVTATAGGSSDDATAIEGREK